MKTIIPLLYLGLLISCTPNETSFSTCYHNEYVIDDLGHIVSPYVFNRFGKFLCQAGTILILADGQTIYEAETENMGDFEMGIDFFPDAFEIRFLGDPYFLHIEVVIDTDLRETRIVEASNLCGGAGRHG